MAQDFLELFNDFYADTDYTEFYNSKLSYFEQVTQKFIDESYSQIDFKWFGKYVDPSNLRCIYSLSSGNYAATTVNDRIVYSLVYGGGEAIVHEFCHHLADKLVNEWYYENQEFKKWFDNSVDAEKMPYYSHSTTMANECFCQPKNQPHILNEKPAIYVPKDGRFAPLTPLSNITNYDKITSRG